MMTNKFLFNKKKSIAMVGVVLTLLIIGKGYSLYKLDSEAKELLKKIELQTDYSTQVDNLAAGKETTELTRNLNGLTSDSELLSYLQNIIQNEEIVVNDFVKRSKSKLEESVGEKIDLLNDLDQIDQQVTNANRGIIDLYFVTESDQALAFRLKIKVKPNGSLVGIFVNQSDLYNYFNTKELSAKISKFQEILATDASSFHMRFVDGLFSSNVVYANFEAGLMIGPDGIFLFKPQPQIDEGLIVDVGLEYYRRNQIILKK